MNGAEVLDDTTVGEEHGTTNDPGTKGEEYTENHGDNPDLGQLPLDRTSLKVSIVVSNSDGSQISEQSKEDDEIDSDSLVDDDHRSDEIDFQVKAESDTVLDVRLHTLENLASDLDGGDDSAKTRSEEHNIGGGLRSFGSTFDGNTTVRLLQGGSIVDTVTSHGSEMATFLQHLDDLVLVLGENFSETIGLLNEIVLSRTRKTTVDETLRVVDLGTESKHLASLLGNSDGITSKHLDGKTKNLGLSDGGSGILTRGVEHRQHAEQLPFLVTFLDSDTKRTETTSSELGSLSLVHVGGLLGAVAEVQDSLGSALGTDVLDTILLALGGDTLGDRVEGSELVSLPASREHFLGSWVSLEGEDSNLVDGVKRLDIVGRSESRDGHHPVDIDTLGDIGVANAELVGSEGTSLIGAEDIDTLHSKLARHSAQY